MGRDVREARDETYARKERSGKTAATRHKNHIPSGSELSLELYATECMALASRSGSLISPHTSPPVVSVGAAVSFHLVTARSGAYLMFAFTILQQGVRDPTSHSQWYSQVWRCERVLQQERLCQCICPSTDFRAH